MKILTGREEFTQNGKSTGYTVSDFWSWGYSELLNNTLRGVLAEFLVYASLNHPREGEMRDNWQSYDVMSPTGRRIEVKSAAYLQIWTDEDHYSQMIFDIAPKLPWGREHGMGSVKNRNCDLYVFCVYTALSREQSILDLDLWGFYVLATFVLDREIPKQKSISLSSLLRFHPVKTNFSKLGETIESIEL
ncbi:MAG: hypothetical protein IJ679_08260 [Lachnospiraceae bacterium]|nr:hypothetical protein [Lachnospiraceae bacterium]